MTYGRSVRLDALCTLGDGKKCNIEIQRSNNDNHLKRVRFNASNITVVNSNKSEKFSKIEDLYVVYISEFDIFKKGYTLYHVDNVVRETGEIVSDGLERIFVNTEVKDETEVSELMSCFLQTDVDNPKFPKFSNRMKFLKSKERGLNAVCEVMERYEKIAAKKAVEEAIKKAQIEKEQALKKAQIEKEQAIDATKAEAKIKEQQAVDAAKAEAKIKEQQAVDAAKAEAKIKEQQAIDAANIKAIKNMINKFHAEKEQILEIYTEEEYNQAVKELQKN